eukprot:11068625-Prorocentrum_lima.AAC.1
MPRPTAAHMCHGCPPGHSLQLRPQYVLVSVAPRKRCLRGWPSDNRGSMKTAVYGGRRGAWQTGHHRGSDDAEQG